MKTLIIGCGNMGKTYARSFLASRFIDASDLHLLCRENARSEIFNDVPRENIHFRLKLKMLLQLHTLEPLSWDNRIE